MAGQVIPGGAIPRDKQHEAPKPPRLLKRKQVEERTCLSCSAIYAGIAAGTFPKPCTIGARSVAWLESEVSAWIAARVSAREVAV